MSMVDRISHLKGLLDGFTATVDKATQLIQQMKMDLIILGEMNVELHVDCSNQLASLAPCDRQKSRLIDQDGTITKGVKNLQNTNDLVLQLENTIMALLVEIKQKYHIVYTNLKSIHAHIKPNEIDHIGYSTELARIHDTLFQRFDDLNSFKKLFRSLQKDKASFQEEINSWKYAFDSPEIFTIKQEDLQALQNYLSGPGESRDTPEKFDHLYKYLEVYQLEQILANQPLSDVIIIECWKQVRFAFWKWKVLQGIMPEGGNIWESFFGKVMNQLTHEICWAIVSSELVSVIRFILNRDHQRIDYSTQCLVDFTKPDLRRTRRNKSHFCYPCHVKDALNYVKDNGIEREETRPFHEECMEYVPPMSSSDLGYIQDVVTLDKIEDALKKLPEHPLAASIPIFEPEYTKIRNKIYFSATSRFSTYRCMHAGNIAGAGEENGEKFFYLRSSHGEQLGVQGYLKVSAEVMGMCLTPDEVEAFIEHPFPLISQFVYPTLLSETAEENRRELDGQASRRREEERRKNEDDQARRRK